ncbi:MAG: cupin domain-containing protein [Planctomycetota bacterium]
MLKRARTLATSLGLCGAVLAAVLLLMHPTDAADGKPPVLNSKVVSWDAAKVHEADWGQMRFYFRGQTHGTKDVLTAVAVVEPGKAVHRAHRHAAEEYLVVAHGSGKWSLAGKEFPAKLGDILYVEPWVYHGLVNTGDEPLVFVVVRYNGKGVQALPKPDDRPNEL